MAEVVRTEEPTVVREERVEHVHETAPAGSSAGTIIAVVILILILLALFWWRPWGHSSSGSGGTNINVTTPSTKSSQ
jgi:hypothetical protein